MPQGGKIFYRFFLFSDGTVAAVLYQTLWGIKRLEAGVPAGSHEWSPSPFLALLAVQSWWSGQVTFTQLFCRTSPFLQFVSTKHCKDFYLTGHIFIYSISHFNFYLKRGFSDCAECWVFISCVPFRLLCGISSFLNW